MSIVRLPQSLTYGTKSGGPRGKSHSEQSCIGYWHDLDDRDVPCSPRVRLDASRLDISPVCQSHLLAAHFSRELPMTDADASSSSPQTADTSVDGESDVCNSVAAA